MTRPRDPRIWITHYQADGETHLACGRANYFGRWRRLNASRNWALVTCKQCLRHKPVTPQPLGAKVPQPAPQVQP